ncbi:hypothetical protein MKX01_014966, partial [Papaver californicum]
MYCKIIGVLDEIKNGTLVQKYDIQEEVYYARPPENEDEDDEDEDDDDDDDSTSPLEDGTALDRENTIPTEKSDTKSKPEPELDPDNDT